MNLWTFFMTLWATPLMVSTMLCGGGSLTGTGSKPASSFNSAGMARSGSRKSRFLCSPGGGVSATGGESAGRPAARFSARWISRSWRARSKTVSSVDLLPSAWARASLAARSARWMLGDIPPLGRNRWPRRRREKLRSLIINSFFGTDRRFAGCQRRSTSRALRTRRN